MDDYEEMLFESVKDVTMGKRSLPRGSKPRGKSSEETAQDIIDSIL